MGSDEGSVRSAEVDAPGLCEVRLALVCYGGVSLAVYMHGVTKEVAKLVAASAAYDADPHRDPFPADDSSSAWYQLLADLDHGRVEVDGRPSEGLRLRVVVDIISGTSAGGINGVCLAKAVAQNRSLDPVRQLWLERGDIGELLSGWARVPWRLRLPSVALGMLAGRAPLRGDAMCHWLASGMRDIDDAGPLVPGLTSLVPTDQALELFVPITDFHGVVRRVPLAGAGEAHDRTHLQLLRFRHDGDGGAAQFGRTYDHALAFAARATSSFPGGFPALSFGDFRRAVPDADLDLLGSDILREYRLSGADPERTSFVDGGVLDNRPFECAIAAIDGRPAAHQVDRRLLYLDPDPGPATDSGGEPPSVIATIVGSVLRIPRVEPIVDDLRRVAARNQAVARVRDVIESRFDGARQRTADHLTGPLDDSDDEILAFLARAADESLAEVPRAEALGYLRARLDSVLEAYTELVAEVADYPPDSWPRQAVREVLHRWAEGHGFYDREADDATVARLRGVLEQFDLDVVARRIRFLLAGLNWWYRDVGRPGQPTRDDLDQGKRSLYDQLLELRRLGRGLGAALPVRALVSEVFGRDNLEALRRGDLDLDQFVARHGPGIEAMRREVAERVPDRRRRVVLAVHRVLLERSQDWDALVRLELLVRHLAFAHFDVAVFPLQRLEGVSETDRVEVYRIGRYERGLLEPADIDDRRLAGAGLHHFGAFFTRRGREKDYLWGRLDAVEALVRLLLDARRGSPAGADATTRSVPEADRRRICAPMFAAVLASERSALPAIDGLVSELGRLAADDRA